jgi:oxygen-dependent protoporphyrinogen oxidase
MRIVVIGGGISGLACAWRLQQLGAPILLLEQEEHCGGVIRSVRRDGLLFEAGPQSFLITEPLLNLVRSLKLEDELLYADSRAPRYVLVDGRLIAVPLAPPALFSSPLLSARTKMRVLGERFRRSQPPEGDESIAAFVRRKFGTELLDRLVAPMVSGIYAGDPERLSMRSSFPTVHEWESRYGSVLRGAMKSRGEKEVRRPVLGAFRQGNASLTQCMEESLAAAVSQRTRVLAVRRRKSNGSPGLEIACEIAGRQEVIPAGALVVAAPAGTAATLMTELVPGAAELARIDYAALAVVAGAYAQTDLAAPLNGFGFLVPRAEGLRVLGTIWNSSQFPARGPQGHAVLTSFVGGATDTAAREMSDDALFQTVETELRRVLGIRAAPRVRFVQRWAQALPQYNLGHGARLLAVREALAKVPGVFLAGNYLQGPSVGSCVENSSQVAQQAYEFWRAAQ